jgi:putative ABC transport system ATP-binding protein
VIIKVRNLKKVYGHGATATHALKDIDMHVEEGEFIAIMGRSGSGKSTLLHLVGLLDMPTGGEIILSDTDVLKLSDGERAGFRLERLGYVFQEYSLLGELTALENVYLPAMCLANVNNHRKRAAGMLESVGLGSRLDHYPNEMSGGEQQRVAVARALINEPKILFADEPTANLDAVSANMVLELFKKVNEERGQTIVMVTHEPEDEKYVDRVIWLKDGLVDKETTTLESDSRRVRLISIPTGLVAE